MVDDVVGRVAHPEEGRRRVEEAGNARSQIDVLPNTLQAGIEEGSLESVQGELGSGGAIFDRLKTLWEDKDGSVSYPGCSEEEKTQLIVNFTSSKVHPKRVLIPLLISSPKRRLQSK